MRYGLSRSLRPLLRLLACVLILKTLVAVALNFYDYFPPRFDQGFLIGREAYFFGPYSWAFYVHFITGPLSLLFGTILMSRTFRSRSPAGHRRLGRVQVVTVLLFVAPSGLWMSFHAETGIVAGAGFATLSILTGVFLAFGWRAAVRKQFAIHQRWMSRCFVLLCSAVVIRMIGGAAVSGRYFADWIYPVSAWISWLLPLILLELFVSRLPQAANSGFQFSHLEPTPQPQVEKGLPKG